MKATLQMYMVAANRKKAGNTIKASIVKNGGKPPLIISVEPKDLPEDFRKVEYKANNEAIRTALEKGDAVPGAELGERGEHLTIN
jgi:hypothetical protein